jgi:mannose-6-phosphate isomerase-like protein (cupin superfamily)
MSDKLSRRLVVTGHDAKGRSRVASDTVVTGVDATGIRGSAISLIWATDDVMHYPDAGEKPATEAFFPPLHGTRMVELYLPANAEYVSRPQDSGSADSRIADAAAHLEADRPGMHRTKTMDFIILMEGRCTVELDDETVTLNPGDVLIQSGTIHAWFNPFDEPCRFMAVMVGANNDLCQ